MNPTAKLVLNIFSIFFAAFFIAPTVAILASWNALPGDALYSTKRTLEKIALAITAPNYSTNSSLHTKLVSRRTDEATALLQKSSTQGLDELKAQAAALRRQIASAPTQAAKQQVAAQAVTELKKTQTKLRQAKTQINQTPPPATPPTGGTTTIIERQVITQQIVQYLPAPANPSPTPTPTPTPTAPTLIAEVEATENVIAETIAGIATDTDATTPTPTNPAPQPSHQNQGQDQGQNQGQGQDDD